MYTYDDISLSVVEPLTTELVFIEDTSLEYVGGGTITNIG